MGKYSGMRERIIPQNVLQGKRILGFKQRNFIEGVIAALIVAVLILQIPFVSKVKMIVLICCMIFVFFINAIGIKGQPLTQAITRFVTYRKYTKQYSYRRLEDARKEVKPVVVNDKVRTITETKATANIKKIVSK